LKAANVGAFALTVSVNALANILPLNGNTTAEISDAYPTLLTPAGYVFSIWALICALQLIFIVYQTYPGQKTQFLAKIGFLFLLSSVANVIWIFLWHYDQIVASILPMFVLLWTLIFIYLRLGIGKVNVLLKEKLCVHVPFSVYLGWITVAAIANVATALVSIRWNGWGLSHVTWSIFMIAFVLVTTAGVIATRKDVAYGLVILWALGGIIVKQTAYPSVVLVTGASAFFTVALITVTLLLRMKSKT